MSCMKPDHPRYQEMQERIRDDEKHAQDRALIDLANELADALETYLRIANTLGPVTEEHARAWVQATTALRAAGRLL